MWRSPSTYARLGQRPRRATRIVVLAIAVLAIVALLGPGQSAQAEMRGHGGPVRSIVVSNDGRNAVTGSFDTTAIIWDLTSGLAQQVLRLHEAPVSLVQLVGGMVVTGSDDGRVAFWQPGEDKPLRIIGERGAPVIGFTSGGLVLHADRTVRLAGNIVRQFNEPVTAHVEDLQRTGRLIVATADARLQVFPRGWTISLPQPANTLAMAPDGEIIAGTAGGYLLWIGSEGDLRRDLAVQDMPVTALALSRDGRRIAAAGLRGSVTILDRATGTIVSRLVGPGLPVWSLAFHPNGQTLLTGGADRMVRQWDVASGQPVAPAVAPRPDFPASVMAMRGAQVFRACDACHTVTSDGGNRAGPTLHGVFGRRIGTLPGYLYSDGFDRHGIIWNAESITRLFRDGPSRVTPGTRMPEQTITDPEDLAALVSWLEQVTRKPVE